MFDDSTLTRSVAENSAAGTDVGTAIPAATDTDGDPLTYALEGTDAASFDFDDKTRQITTKSGITYDHEAKSTYSVAVKADDGNGGTDSVAVTITVTDENEPPAAPAAPTVTPTAGATHTSLTVSWIAVDDATGKPPVVGYRVQFRAVGILSWTWFTDIIPRDVLSYSFTGLDPDTTYEARVKAGNQEGFGLWSSLGRGTTTANSPPMFDDSTLTRSVAENSAAGTDVGTAIPAATDTDGDPLTYALEGTDAASFDFDDKTRQITTKSGITYDHEAKSTYSVAVKADDGNGGTDSVAVTITVTDENEPPAAPAAPTVTPTAGATTGLDVTWTAPDNTGKPEISSYDLRYGMDGMRWTNGPQDWTGTSASIAGLSSGTAYQVQVRATNADGDSDWSSSGTGTTNAPNNTAPTVANAIPDRSATVGAAFSYTFPSNAFADADGDALTYTATRPDDSALPTWLTFAANTRTFAGTPAASDVGTVSVKVTASDGSLSAEDTFDVTVNAAPTDPVVSIAGGATVTEGGAATFTLTANPAPAGNVSVAVQVTQSGRFASPGQTGSRTVTVGTSGTAAFTVATDDDDADEPNGAVTATVESGSGYSPHGTSASATVAVTDDDPPPPGGGVRTDQPIPDQEVVAWASTEVPLGPAFFDPGHRQLEYAASSSDPTVAAACALRDVFGAPVLTVWGLEPGTARLEVTARVPGGQEASQDFLVRVSGPQGLWLLPSATDPEGRQGFVRLLNGSDAEASASVRAADDRGARRGPLSLAVAAGAARGFNSLHLEDGAPERGLAEGTGPGEGFWRLAVSGPQGLEALPYLRAADGFVTSMRTLAPAEPGADCAWRHHAATFNPASNWAQRSLLRIVNPGADDLTVAVTGTDDAGAPGLGALSVEAPAGRAVHVEAEELERALGDGAGKWRLVVEASRPLPVMSLMRSPAGHLSNLSGGSPAPLADGSRPVWLLPSASDPNWEGFVRVVNHSAQAGEVRVEAFGPDGRPAGGSLSLSLAAGAAAHFNSTDLELGNAAKGLSGAAGPGAGDWWLRLSGDPDFEAYPLLRTRLGFVTAMAAVAPEAAGSEAGARAYRVAFLNPGRNANQVSRLRIVNPNAEPASVTVTGVDDAGNPGAAAVAATVPAMGAVEFRAAEGGQRPGLELAFGAGSGKWRLIVRSDRDVAVLSLLESPGGHLANLSAAALPPAE